MATMRERQREVQLYRGQVPSPGRPTVAWRDDRVRFRAAIARGLKTEHAANEAGVSPPVAFRWFRHAGGVNPCLSPKVSGRYLSFVEREGIALLRAQGFGVREIARRLSRSPSTISRELRRNASTRTWRLEYKASTAQWHAERRAPPAQGSQADHERRAPRLRAGQARRCGLQARRSSCRSARAEVERQEQAVPRRPPVGAGLEPRANRASSSCRLPG